MKDVLLFITLLIGGISFGQTIMVNGSPYLATQNNSFPFWLDAGSTLSTNPPMNFISVVEYNENEVGGDTNLGYSKVLSITESSVVPDGKVWKVISALKHHYEGCTDPIAFNYDPQANFDDGSCVEVVEGCDNPDATNFNSSVNLNNGTCTYFNISELLLGDIAFGGIVFYINEEEGYGLVVALSDIEFGPYPWGCDGSQVSGADSKDIGSGPQNTYDIVQHACDISPTAAQAADEYFTDQYTDWYLPSLFELNEIYLVLGADNSYDEYFTNTWYWSSSENDNNTAWYVNFSNGYNSDFSKENPNQARAIRTFNF